MAATKREYVTVRRRPMQQADDWQVWAGRRIIFRGMRTRQHAIAMAATKGYEVFIAGALPDEGRCYRSAVEIGHG